MRNKTMQQISGLCTTRVCVLFLAVLCGLAMQAQVGGAVGSSGRKERSDKAYLIELHENNWELMLQGEWMVEFFAPWCPACKSLAPTWEQFAANGHDANVNVAKIDVTTSPSLSGRFFVTALPTIYHVKDGEFRQYRGSRDIDAFMFFIKQKQWNKIEPVSAWKKPNTIHMSILSYFFKLSHIMKDFNTRLQEEYGLPTWGSYGLFALGTIFVGAALGLLLVCLVDLLYPPKKSQRRSFSESKDNGLEDEIDNDELEIDAQRTMTVADDDDEEDESEGEESENEDEKSEEDKSEHVDAEGKDNNNTSDGEKYSNSDTEEQTVGDKAASSKQDKKPISDDVQQAVATAVDGPASPGEARKRKPRKDD